jgi:hypothetical protein
MPVGHFYIVTPSKTFAQATADKTQGISTNLDEIIITQIVNSLTAVFQHLNLQIVATYF